MIRLGDLQIGLANLHVAVMTTEDDVDTAAIYDAPAYVSPMVTAQMSSKSSATTFYGDDQALAVATKDGEITITIEQKDLTLTQRALFLGQTISGGVLSENNTDNAPYVALMFESKKKNGKKRFVKLYKGKFMNLDDSYKTAADKVEFQTAKLVATFVARANDGKKRDFADEEEQDYVSSVGSGWYTSVDGNPDTTPPTVTVVPADAATGVALAATVAWTFNEAIRASTMLPSNFFLMEADGTPVAGTLSINTGHTIVTFTPTANLITATDYVAIATVGVKDIAGNALAAPSVSNFTTV